MKTIFELKDIEPQLTEEQLRDLKHEIKLVKRGSLGEGPHAVSIGECGRKIVILTSGKMIFVPEEEQKAVCSECGQEKKIEKF